MRITARAEYAVRAMAELAAADETLTADDIATRQEIPRSFLMGILSELRRANLATSVRGSSGGWRLAAGAADATLADVVRAVEGPLATVSQERPEDLKYQGPTAVLQLVWVALRASIRDVLESVTISDVAKGTLPEAIMARSQDEDAWRSR